MINSNDIENVLPSWYQSDRRVIEFNQVSKKYFSLTALQDITLTIPQGEVVGLLGPNGAGKTTFIKLVAPLVEK